MADCEVEMPHEQNLNTNPTSAEPITNNDEANILPSTVTVLDGPHGSKVYLVGTAHFSLESQKDVSKVIQMVKPHVVMVELCEQRTNILLLDEATILREAKDVNIHKIRSLMSENGAVNGLMYILILSMSAHITQQLGMAPGGEFRRALEEAKKLKKCAIHLGDRPLNITLQRAIASLSWWQTVRFVWHLLISNTTISPEDVEKCKQKALLDAMLEEMAADFPSLKEILVHERDKYLAHSLNMAISSVHAGAGTENCRVVGIVGLGHVAGIKDNWLKVKSEDIIPLLKIPPTSRSTRVLRACFKVGCAGAAVYIVYKIVPKRWFI